FAIGDIKSYAQTFTCRKLHNMLRNVSVLCPYPDWTTRSWSGPCMALKGLSSCFSTAELIRDEQSRREDDIQIYRAGQGELQKRRPDRKSIAQSPTGRPIGSIKDCARSHPESSRESGERRCPSMVKGFSGG